MRAFPAARAGAGAGGSVKAGAKASKPKTTPRAAKPKKAPAAKAAKASETPKKVVSKKLKPWEALDPKTGALRTCDH